MIALKNFSWFHRSTQTIKKYKEGDQFTSSEIVLAVRLGLVGEEPKKIEVLEGSHEKKSSKTK